MEALNQSVPEKPSIGRRIARRLSRFGTMMLTLGVLPEERKDQSKELFATGGASAFKSEQSNAEPESVRPQPAEDIGITATQVEVDIER